MDTHVLIIAFGLLVTGITSEKVPEETLSIGEYLHTSVTTLRALNTFNCSLETPNKDIIQFHPNNEGDTTKYSLREQTIRVGCAVDIAITADSDNGLWRLYVEYEDGGIASDSHLITVDTTGSPAPIANIEDVTSENVPEVTLSIGEYLHTSVTTIRALNTFNCSLETPNKDIIQFHPNNEGDTTKYSLREQTIMVGCAVDIAITADSDNGLWRLYVEYEDGGTASDSRRVTVDTTGSPAPIEGVTSENVAEETLSIGEYLHTSVTTSRALNTFNCSLETPNKDIIQIHPNNEGDVTKYSLREQTIRVGCAVDIAITADSDNGLWSLYAEFEDGGTIIDSHHVTFDKTGPPAPIEDSSDMVTLQNRDIEELKSEFFESYIGANHTIVIPKYDFVYTDTCHIITPEGDDYQMDDNGYKSNTNFEWVKGINVACGVKIYVNSEDAIGNWTIFSRDHRHSDPIERRLSFSIEAQETVEALPNETSIVEGKDLHLRLRNSASNLQDTCKLIGPTNSNSTYSLDDNHRDFCGFIIKNIQISDMGKWYIEFGKKIIYRAPIDVTVIDSFGNSIQTVDWVLGQPIDVFVGPEDALHCHVALRSGLVHSEKFGRCHISLPRVERSHQGIWQLTFSTPGRVYPEIKFIDVNIVYEEPKLRIVSSVEKQQPDVLLACTLPGHHDIRACTFENPYGLNLNAAEGVGEYRYSYYSSNNASDNGTSCGLRIANATTEDLGIWKCGIATATGEVYHAFLTVVCPWAMSDPIVAAAVVTVPAITASQTTLIGTPNEPWTLSCSIPAAIRYCYFRNGPNVIYNVSPGTKTEDFEYIGSGFDAGECGIKLLKPRNEISGKWTCNVGLLDSSRPEQSAATTVLWHHGGLDVSRYLRGHTLYIESSHTNHQLEYCRFVRHDGLGFSDDNKPAGYVIDNSLTWGTCHLEVERPTREDIVLPWTVVVKVKGEEQEISGTITFIDTPTVYSYSKSYTLTFFIMMICMMVLILLICVAKKYSPAIKTRLGSLRWRLDKTPPTSQPPQPAQAEPVFETKLPLPV